MKWWQLAAITLPLKSCMIGTTSGFYHTHSHTHWQCYSLKITAFSTSLTSFIILTRCLTSYLFYYNFFIIILVPYRTVPYSSLFTPVSDILLKRIYNPSLLLYFTGKLPTCLPRLLANKLLNSLYLLIVLWLVSSSFFDSF